MSWDGDYSVRVRNTISGNKLKHVYGHMYDKGVDQMSLSVMITAIPDDSFTAMTHESKHVLYNTSWNVLPLMQQCCKNLRKCLGFLSGIHADPANGQAKEMSGRYGTAALW